MKRFIYYFIIELNLVFFISFTLQAQFSTSYNDNHYEECQKILKRLERVAGSNSTNLPELVITDGNGKWQVAGFEHNGNPTIYLNKGIFEAFRSLGKDSLDALALILGHELAHYYREHQRASGYSMAANQDEMTMEIEADYLSAFYGSLAGYKTVEILPDVLDRIYSYFNLPDNIGGYPSKKERFRLVKEKSMELKHLLPIYKAGRFLYLNKEYSVAAKCFEYVAKKFPTSEVYNNLGVCQLGEALQYLDSEDKYYAFPFEIDAKSRLQNLVTRSSENKQLRKEKFKHLLTTAKGNFQNAINRDEGYLSANINLACINILEGNPENAAGKMKELEQKLSKTTNLPANAYLIRAIAYDKMENYSKAEEDFHKAIELEAYMGTYNFDLFVEKNKSMFSLARFMKLSKNWFGDKVNHSACRGATILDTKIGSLTFPSIEKERCEASYVKDEYISVYSLKELDATGMLINYMNNNQQEFYYRVISTMPDYQDQTDKSIVIGSTLEALERQYCQPDYIIPAANNTSYYVYKDQIIFELENKRVVGWHLLEILEY